MPRRKNKDDFEIAKQWGAASTISPCHNKNRLPRVTIAYDFYCSPPSIREKQNYQG